MCTRLPHASFYTIFTGINVIISMTFLIAYFDMIPNFTTPIFVEQYPTRKISSIENATQTLSFKDIILKFRFCRFPEAILDVCDRGNLTLLVVVQSAPASVQIRDVIRATWANRNAVASLKDGSARVVFLIGNGDNPSEAMQNEMNKHQDIILVDAEDSYKNLVFKTALTLHIAHVHCPTQFLLKIDEDVVFNIDRFMSGINETFYDQIPAIYCKIWRGAKPARDSKNDWFVSEHQFRGHKFPDYCAGPAYVLSSEAVTSLLKALPDFNLITVEDVFITGIIAESAGVKRVDMEGRFKSDYSALEYTADACPGQLLSVHNLKTRKQIRDMWRFLSKKC